MFLSLRAPLSTFILTLANVALSMGLWIFGTSNGTAHWEPDPSTGRGTWSILSSCIITLSLCVYTALHLNIPANKSGSLVSLGFKAKYVLFGLLAPELIVYNAWRQRTAAMSLVSKIRLVRGGRRPVGWVKRVVRRVMLWGRAVGAAVKGQKWRHIEQILRAEQEVRLPWDMARDKWTGITLFHGFYISMGGYALEMGDDEEPRLWPLETKRLAISPKGVAACLGSEDPELRNMIPFLSKEEIWDKSKANGLAKAIVCIQALWFMIQVIGRLSQGYPISLLELNVFAHALCALLVYLLWWDKPLDIEEPTVIKTCDSTAAKNLAVMGWNGQQAPVEHLKVVHDLAGGFWTTLLKRVWHAVGASSDGPLSDNALMVPEVPMTFNNKDKIRVIIASLDRTDLPSPSKCPDFTGLTIEERSKCEWVSTFPPVFRVNGGDTIPSTSMVLAGGWESVEVDEILLARIKAMEQLRSSPEYPIYEKALRPVLAINDKDLTILKPRELNFSDSLMRNSFEDVSPVSRNLIATTGIILSGFIYGALHMLAWGSGAFNSRAEQVLWIVACCTVALGGLAVFLGIWLLDKLSYANITVFGIRASTLAIFIASPVGIVIAFLYAASRVYLLVEVFRNLAYLDPQVYATPDWPVYFPHIS